ncbi:MAG: DUF5107 domain-containing protein [Anaerolineae bacterium]|nr:DUF5107 domain-containing protein [Anaerolineae bacterium]
MTACSTIAEPVVVVATSAPTETSVPVLSEGKDPVQSATAPPFVSVVEAPTASPPPPTFTPLPSATPTTPPTVQNTPTLNPTPSPTPTNAIKTEATELNALPQAVANGLQVYQTPVTLPTYPIRDYLVEQIDPIYQIPVYYFNRQAYEAANPSPEPVEYSGVVLENPYLRLTFLPELGGRLYSAVVKSTGQEIFYHNQVVKPSRFGVLQLVEANWWLATGGMEWAYPTQEHGYRWGVPWDYQVTQTTEAATITLSDAAPGRVGVEVQVTLPANRATFTITPKLINLTAEAVPVQFWLNAALSLAPETMSLETRFVVPADRGVVHSRGESGWTVPEAGQELSWPQVGERDLSDYGQWTDYLGFFAPHLAAPFMGAYNPETDLGVARLLKPGAIPGNKLFAFGPHFPDRSYTDNDSQYFEIWGGINTGFWPEDDVSVPGGETLHWQESWWPLAGLGGLTWANEHTAIFVSQADDGYNLSVLASEPQQGTLTVFAGETPIVVESFVADPAEPLRWDFRTSASPTRIQLADSQDNVLLDYCIYSTAS